MFDSQIINDPSTEYTDNAYAALEDIFEQMIDTLYDENALKAALVDVLTEGFTIEPMESDKLLLSVLYDGESVLDYDITIKDGSFYDCQLHRDFEDREKEDWEKVVDVIYERLNK